MASVNYNRMSDVLKMLISMLLGMIAFFWRIEHEHLKDLELRMRLVERNQSCVMTRLDIDAESLKKPP